MCVCFQCVITITTTTNIRDSHKRYLSFINIYTHTRYTHKCTVSLWVIQLLSTQKKWFELKCSSFAIVIVVVPSFFWLQGNSHCRSSSRFSLFFSRPVQCVVLNSIDKSNRFNYSGKKEKFTFADLLFTSILSNKFGFDRTIHTRTMARNRKYSTLTYRIEKKRNEKKVNSHPLETRKTQSVMVWSLYAFIANGLRFVCSSVWSTAATAAPEYW